jgi:hypothetical protein
VLTPRAYPANKGQRTAGVGSFFFVFPHSPPPYNIHPLVPLRVDAAPPNSLLSSPYHHTVMWAIGLEGKEDDHDDPRSRWDTTLERMG